MTESFLDYIESCPVVFEVLGHFEDFKSSQKENRFARLLKLKDLTNELKGTRRRRKVTKIEEDPRRLSYNRNQVEI